MLHAAHRRWGLAVPAALALGAAGVDAGLFGGRLSAIGYANYLLVWGSMHQWGFAWQDRTLTRPWWRPYALAAGGAVALACLLAWSPFPVDMVADDRTRRQHRAAVRGAARLRRRAVRAGARRRAVCHPGAGQARAVARRQLAQRADADHLSLAHGARGRGGRGPVSRRPAGPAGHRVGRVVGAAASLDRGAGPAPGPGGHLAGPVRAAAEAPPRAGCAQIRRAPRTRCATRIRAARARTRRAAQTGCAGPRSHPACWRPASPPPGSHWPSSR